MGAYKELLKKYQIDFLLLYPLAKRQENRFQKTNKGDKLHYGKKNDDHGR